MLITPIEWIIFIITLIILILLIIMTIKTYKTANKLGKSEEIILSTANNLNSSATKVNNLVTQAESTVNWLENKFCESSFFNNPKPPFCP